MVLANGQFTAKPLRSLSSGAGGGDSTFPGRLRGNAFVLILREMRDWEIETLAYVRCRTYRGVRRHIGYWDGRSPNIGEIMNVPESIQRKCLDYRAMFSTDKAMGDSLGISAQHARQLVAGDDYPSLDLMIAIQEALLWRRRPSKRRTG